MWALLPVKRFAMGKSRLTAVLSQRQRAEFTCHMLHDVLTVLRSARCIERIVVLSNEPGIDGVLEAVGVERRSEAREGDVNGSLTAAAAGLPDGAGRVLILPSDVPTVCAADIEALSRTDSPITLCPASYGGGTNALLSRLPLAISLRFGEGSIGNHFADAQRRGVSARVISLPGLARDIDWPCDLEWLAGSSHSGRAASYARQLLQRQAQLEAI